MKQIRSDRRLADASGSYPRLQTSFYRELRKKYPIAFQRFPGEDTPKNGEQPVENGVRDGHQGETTAPAAPEDGDLTKCEAPDKKDGIHPVMSVKEKLHENSGSIHSLLHKDMPFENLKTGSSRLSKYDEKQKQSMVGDGQHLNGSLKDSNSATNLRERIAQNNAQLQVYRSKLEHSIKLSEKPEKITVKADVHDVDLFMGRKTVTKTQKKNPTQKGGNSDVVSLESPADSAIEMDSASLQSIMSGLTDHGHTNHFILPAVDNLDAIIDAQWESDFSHFEEETSVNCNKENGLTGQVHDPVFNQQLCEHLESSHSVDNGRVKRGKSSVQERRQANRERELELERLSAELNRNCSQLSTDEDEELLLSLTTDLLSPHATKPTPVLSDLIDDTDPRLAVPEQPENLELEREIAQRYRRKKAMRARSRSTLPRPKLVSSQNGNYMTQSESESEKAFTGQRSELHVNLKSESKNREQTSSQGICDMQRIFAVHGSDSETLLEFKEKASVKSDFDSKESGENEENRITSVLLDNEEWVSKPDKSLSEDSRPPGSKVIESDGDPAVPCVNSKLLPSSEIACETDQTQVDECLAHSLDSETVSQKTEVQSKCENCIENRHESPDLGNGGLLPGNSVESDDIQTTVNQDDRFPGFGSKLISESPKSTGVLRNNSSAERKLTPYEMSVCVDRFSPKKNLDIGKIYSAKQIHIAESGTDLGQKEPHGTLQTQLELELGHKSGETVNGLAEHIRLPSVSCKVDNSSENSRLPPVHYKKRTSTEADQRRPTAVMPKRILNGLNLGKGGNPLRASNPCLVAASSQISHVEGNRYNQRTNLQSAKGLSGSKPSLFNSAKARIQSLRKAKSMDQLHQPDMETDKENQLNSALTMSSHHYGDLPPPPPPPGRVKKSTSFKSLLNFGRKSKDGSHASKPRRGSTPVSFIKKLRKSSSVQNVGVDTPTHPRAIGRLLELKPDGTQTVELTRPPHGPFGIYIARATAQYNYSVFVTRFSDGHPEKLFAGLLNVGDEILEINDSSVKNLSLDEVYNLMGSTNTMVLRTVPVWCREEYTAHR